MQSNFYACFRHETHGRDDCAKIVKLGAKTTSRGHCPGDVDEPNLLKKVTNHACMPMILKASVCLRL